MENFNEENGMNMNQEMASKIEEKVDEIYEWTFSVLNKCKHLIDSRPGRLANRLEDMSEPISDGFLHQVGGKMKPFDKEYYIPLLANGVIPSWKNGFTQLYVRVNGGFEYKTCAYKGKVLKENDPRNNSYHFNSGDRDFLAIDLEQESDGIIEDIYELMDALDE